MSWADDKTDLMLKDIHALDGIVVTPEDEQKARLTVCDATGDATIARDILDALGLLP